MHLPPPSQPRGNGLAVVVLVLLAIALYGYLCTQYLWPLGDFGSWSQHWPYLKEGLYGLLNRPNRGALWWQYHDTLRMAGYRWALYLRLAALGGGSVIIAILITLRFYTIRRTRDRHVRGLNYLQDTRAALRQAQRQAAMERRKDSRGGVRVHPKLPTGANRENLGILTVGSRGSGKTQFLLPLVTQVIEQGHRAVIFDYKGEYTEVLPLPDDQFVLIAPWDRRSALWHIAADVRTRSDARLIAQQMIRDSDDPMWSNAARQVLTGLIHYLCQTNPGLWRFTDLAQLISAGNEHLAFVLRHGNREAIRIVENLLEEGRTAQSVMLNMSAYMSPIMDLADAWDDPHEALPEALLESAFSIHRWLAEDYTGPKVLVLQGSARYEPLMQGLLSAFLAVLIAAIVDPSFPEAAHRQADYRLFFFLDEFPRLGRITDIEKLISVGRSKGIRPILGFQDIAQVRHTYGSDLANAWFSQFGIQFFGRVAPGDTARWIAGVFDKHEVDRPNPTLSASGGGPGMSESLAWQTLEKPILLPSQLATDLHAGPDGVTALLHCTGWPHLYRLQWPLTKLPRRRPASVSADWLQAFRPALPNENAPAETGKGDGSESAPPYIRKSSPATRPQR